MNAFFRRRRSLVFVFKRDEDLSVAPCPDRKRNGFVLQS